MADELTRFDVSVPVQGRISVSVWAASEDEAREQAKAKLPTKPDRYGDNLYLDQLGIDYPLEIEVREYVKPWREVGLQTLFQCVNPVPPIPTK